MDVMYNYSKDSPYEKGFGEYIFCAINTSDWVFFVLKNIWNCRSIVTTRFERVHSENWRTVVYQASFNKKEQLKNLRYFSCSH